MKLLLTDAICGIGFPSVATAMEAEKSHMAYFTGNQHNPEWKWIRGKLECLTEEQLQALYEGLRNDRERLAETDHAS